MGFGAFPPARAQTLGRDLLKRLSLWEVRQDLCETFSLGMRQKLALAGGANPRPAADHSG